MIQIDFHAILSAWRLIAYLKWKMKEKKCLVNDGISKFEFSSVFGRAHNGNTEIWVRHSVGRGVRENFSAFQKKKIPSKTDLVLFGMRFHLNVMINYGLCHRHRIATKAIMKSRKKNFLLTHSTGLASMFCSEKAIILMSFLTKQTSAHNTVCAHFSSAWNSKRQKSDSTSVVVTVVGMVVIYPNTHCHNGKRRIRNSQHSLTHKRNMDENEP